MKQVNWEKLLEFLAELDYDEAVAEKIGSRNARRIIGGYRRELAELLSEIEKTEEFAG